MEKNTSLIKVLPLKCIQVKLHSKTCHKTTKIPKLCIHFLSKPENVFTRSFNLHSKWYLQLSDRCISVKSVVLPFEMWGRSRKSPIMDTQVKYNYLKIILKVNENIYSAFLVIFHVCFTRTRVFLCVRPFMLLQSGDLRAKPGVLVVGSRERKSQF